MNPFIDDEAAVDSFDEDDDDFQSADDTSFIDDRNTTEGLYSFPSDNPVSNFLDGEDLFNDDNDTMSRFYDNLLTRASKNATRQSYNRTNDESLFDDILRRQIRTDDYPIWKIRCKIGLEEIAVCSLLRAADTNLQLRSAFTRGSIRGSIYLECQMNKDLLDLLAKTSGVIRTAQGIISKKIDPNEYHDLLRMKTIKLNIAVDNWVQIKKGIYKGDVGRVRATHAWGVDVYLVPRIPTQNTASTRKRKASTVIPEAKLFFPQYSTENVYYPDGSCKTAHLVFAHGLIIKTFDYHSTDPQVSEISWKTYNFFLQSKHPDIPLSSLPRPREWIFVKGDNVIIHPFNRNGSIMSIETDRAEVEIPGEGLHHVSWHKIRKTFKVGDFVRITGGPSYNTTGWMIDINEDIATVTSKVLEGEIDKNFAGAINSVNVHLNLLVAASVPFQYATEAQPTSLDFQLVKQYKHVWCGTDIIIAKRGSAWKGKTGKVTQVLHGQPTATGLKLAIQLTQYDPFAPFQTIIVDYDDVYEITSVRKLHECFGPEDDRRFIEPPLQQTPDPVMASGGATPMPTETSSTSPAWNPSSETPSHIPTYPSHSTSTVNRDSNSQVDLSIAGTSQPRDHHVLLNPLLAGKKINAIVNGGEYKQKTLEVTISVLQERVLLNHTKYHTTYPLKPDWVTPKHPSPTHDNGLLIIIKGSHCSKYARRIHHRHSNTGSTIFLAVTQRVEGSADIVTDERLELAPEYLCTVLETKAEKDLNKDLMKSLRSTYKNNSALE